MVAVFNKELLSWYLITLKLRETVQQNAISDGDLEEDAGQAQQKDAAKLEPDSDWVISIKEKLKQSSQEEDAGSWSKLSIYRIPKCLRGSDEDKSFIPQMVSIGPYHHGKRRFRDMEHHKWRSFRHALERNKQDARIYSDSMKELEARARECYEGNISLSSDEFCEMMMLDGCFVLELFRGAAGGFKNLGYSRNDPVFAMRGSMHSIQRDMIMLENQLPLFVLEKLYTLQEGDQSKGPMVAKLSLQFFDPLMPNDEPLDISLVKTTTQLFDPLTEGGLHCLDVFRRSLLRSDPAEPVKVPKIWHRRRSSAVRVADKRRQQFVHCVTELREAGIKVRKRKTDRFWDIRFERGFLKMPRLLIHDGTKSLFLNLIAFEQCHLDCSNDITSYVIFMDNLINSSEDVRYLHYRGIIEHWLGSDDEVADLFNKLCEEVVFDINESYLSELSQHMNHYYSNRWNTWTASLKHTYFSNPWAIMSLLAAIVLLLLTFAQTFYSVYSYYKPRN